MSNYKHLPKSLPKTNPFFEIKNIVGETTKQEYSGKFVCKIPNLRIQAQIDKYFRFLNGGMDATLDKRTLNLHRMASYCKFTLIEAEDWFRDTDYGLDLYDENVLEEVYNNILEKEEEWLTSIWGDQEEKSDE